MNPQNYTDIYIPPLINYTVPAFLFFIALEWFLILRQQKKYPVKNTIASIAIGVGTLVVDFIMKSALIAGVLYLGSLSPFRLSTAWFVWLICFMVIDLCTYLGHVMGHRFRFFWASHVPHHSPTVYNLSVGVRLSWLQHLKAFVFTPVPLLGFDPFMILVCYQISVIYQFWIHTELIGKLGWLEWIFVTPSNHRVHHAVNSQYINKNFGAILLIWDRLFGTYEPERERPQYGITIPLHSYNPLTITFHEFIALFRDVSKAKTWREKLNYLFKRPGWKP